ncbi:hypothetical protein ACJX0J_007348, partial [Zea mays]
MERKSRVVQIQNRICATCHNMDGEPKKDCFERRAIEIRHTCQQHANFVAYLFTTLFEEQETLWCLYDTGNVSVGTDDEVISLCLYPTEAKKLSQMAKTMEGRNFLS